MTMRTARCLVVLGDSVSSGVGDERADTAEPGVGGFLRSALPGCRAYHNFARPGARAREVLEVQVPRALALEPDVALLIAGGNDVLRANYDPRDILHCLRHAAHHLTRRGAEVMLMRLHEPSRNIRLPRRLSRLLEERIDHVNAAVTSVTEEFDLACLDVRRLGATYERRSWHIDRMHPSTRGHLELAEAFADLLARRGFATASPQGPLEATRTRREDLVWMLRHGVPWFVKRCKDLFPGIGWLLLREIARDATQRLRVRSTPTPIALPSGTGGEDDSEVRLAA